MSLIAAFRRLFAGYGDKVWQFPLTRPDYGIDELARTTPAEPKPVPGLAEKPDCYEITAAMPDMGPRDIDIRLAGKTIRVTGADARERRFDLPEGVDATRIAARFAGGMLILTLPKLATAPTEERKIELRP